MTAFRAAIALGAGIECDVRLARDDEAMVFHDADLARMCGMSASFASLPSSTLGGLRLADTSERVPRLAELLAHTSRRTPLLIELKTDRGHAGRLCRAVDRSLGGAPVAVGVMSFDPHVGAWFARHRPDIRRGLVVADSLSAVRRWWAVLLARPTFLAVDRAALGKPWVARARLCMPVYSWTIRSPRDRKAARALADGLIWEADGRP